MSNDVKFGEHMTDPTEMTALQLHAEVERLYVLNRQIAKLEADAKFLKNRVLVAIMCQGEDGGTLARVPEFGSARIRTKQTRTIKAEKLVAAGVDPDIINDATDVTESEPYVQLYPSTDRKAKAGDTSTELDALQSGW